MSQFLRDTPHGVEKAFMHDQFTAREKGHALYVLEGQVKLARHPYDRDPASGSGNCWCGRDQSHKLHQIVLDA